MSGRAGGYFGAERERESEVSGRFVCSEIANKFDLLALGNLSDVHHHPTIIASLFIVRALYSASCTYLYLVKDRVL